MHSGGRDRALALGIAEFVAILVIAAGLYILMDPSATEIIAVSSSYTDNAAAQDHINVLEKIWEAILVFIMFLAGLFIVARAVFESRRPG